MNSDYDVRLATLEKMGGDVSKNYASVYDIDLAILAATGGGSGGGIPEAPIDGKKYARKDGTWSEVNEPDLTDYATKTWVGEQGYLTSVPSEYVTDTELATELSGYATDSDLTTGLSGKQDTISDLATIRSGAALGSTALQSVPEGYATETWVGQQGYLTSIPVSYCQVVTLTQAQYDALATKDAHTLYIISDAS